MVNYLAQLCGSNFIIHISLFLSSLQYSSAGDDGIWPEYNSFPSFRPPATMFGGPFSNRPRNGAIRRNGKVTSIGPQPPFVLYGSHPPAPSCAGSPTMSYCITDQEYPSELMTSCMLEDIDLFKHLRSKVQWSCEEFPDDMLFPKELPTITPSTNAAADAEEPTEPETSQPIRKTVQKAPPPRPIQERLTHSAKPSATPRRVDNRRGKRDDTSSHQYQYGHSRLMFPMSGMNYTYEVCPSTANHAVGVVKAQTENGEWMTLVQMGQCKQVIRMEECTRPDEPCEHLCSNLKSYCMQRYSVQQLLTCTPGRGLHLEGFKVPSSCGCQVELSMYSTTPDPHGDR